VSGLLPALLADLAAESADLDDLVAALPADGWATPTPAAGWTVAHQVAHLAWTDELAVGAVTRPAEFDADPSEGSVDRAATEGAAAPPAELLDRWRSARASLAAALTALPAGAAITWFGPPMSAASMATARLMETWAHGVDVRDALGRETPATPRLRHVAHLGVRTRGYAFGQHGLPAPAADVRVELTGPDGEVWTWGDPDAPERVTGPALDFCLLVSRRRHRDDLGLHAQGPGADRWLDVAQAFAGPPGAGRPPRGQHDPPADRTPADH
jgi:uncharacterized protein (TIGR03084 family)